MNNDSISRQDAIDAFAKFLSDREGGNKIWWKPVAESVVDALPPVWPNIDEFLRNKSPKEHREILHWIAIHYYPRDSKEVLQAVSNMIRPDTNGGSNG